MLKLNENYAVFSNELSLMVDLCRSLHIFHLPSLALGTLWAVGCLLTFISFIEISRDEFLLIISYI